MKITRKDIGGALKVLGVLILVAIAIGGTCFVFFKYLGKQEYCYEHVGSYIYSEDREIFKEKLNKVNGANCANGLLDEVLDDYDISILTQKALVPYLSTYDVDDDAIIDRLEEVKEAENTCNDRIGEYLVRASDNGDITFDKTEVSEIYKSLANLIVKQADFTSYVNSQILAHSTFANVDAKFAVVDVYTRVLNTAYSNLKTDGTLGLNATNRNNLDVANEVLNFQDTRLEFAGSYMDVNNFIKNYNECDQQEFATKLKENTASTLVWSDSFNTLQKAGYYFNTMFGRA